MACPKAHQEVTLQVSEENRAKAAAVYAEFMEPFLKTIPGAAQKVLLIRSTNGQVLHGFDSVAQVQACLTSPLFTHDVVMTLTPLLDAPPDVRIYQANQLEPRALCGILGRVTRCNSVAFRKLARHRIQICRGEARKHRLAQRNPVPRAIPGNRRLGPPPNHVVRREIPPLRHP